MGAPAVSHTIDPPPTEVEVGAMAEPGASKFGPGTWELAYQ